MALGMLKSKLQHKNDSQHGKKSGRGLAPGKRLFQEYRSKDQGVDGAGLIEDSRVTRGRIFHTPYPKNECQVRTQESPRQ